MATADGNIQPINEEKQRAFWENLIKTQKEKNAALEKQIKWKRYELGLPGAVKPSSEYLCECGDNYIPDQQPVSVEAEVCNCETQTEACDCASLSTKQLKLDVILPYKSNDEPVQQYNAACTCELEQCKYESLCDCEITSESAEKSSITDEHESTHDTLTEDVDSPPTNSNSRRKSSTVSNTDKANKSTEPPAENADCACETDYCLLVNFCDCAPEETNRRRSSCASNTSNKESSITDVNNNEVDDCKLDPSCKCPSGDRYKKKLAKKLEKFKNAVKIKGQVSDGTYLSLYLVCDSTCSSSSSIDSDDENCLTEDKKAVCECYSIFCDEECDCVDYQSKTTKNEECDCFSVFCDEECNCPDKETEGTETKTCDCDVCDKGDSCSCLYEHTDDVYEEMCSCGTSPSRPSSNGSNEPPADGAGGDVCSCGTNPSCLYDETFVCTCGTSTEAKDTEFSVRLDDLKYMAELEELMAKEKQLKEELAELERLELSQMPVDPRIAMEFEKLRDEIDEYMERMDEEVFFSIHREKIQHTKLEREILKLTKGVISSQQNFKREVQGVIYTLQDTWNSLTESI